MVNHYTNFGEDFKLISTDAKADSLKLLIRMSGVNNPRVAIAVSNLRGTPAIAVNTGFGDAVDATLPTITYAENTLTIPYPAIEVWSDAIISGFVLAYYYDSDGRIYDKNQINFKSATSTIAKRIEYHEGEIKRLQEFIEQLTNTQGIITVTLPDGRTETYANYAAIQSAINRHVDRLAVFETASKGGAFMGAIVR